MKIMICGGGTAGHVYPGLALAEALKSKNDAKIVFVGTERGLERQLVGQAGYLLETLPTRGLPRRLSFGTLGFLTALAASFAKSFGLIRRHRPDVVIGMGGFVSFPVVLLAARLGYPTLIHEQNAIPGLANRWLSSRVDLVALSHENEPSMVKSAKVTKVVGNPVRRAVLKAGRGTAVTKLGLDEGRLTVLIFGGSRGAQKINEAVIGSYDSFRHANNLQIVHITGMIEHETINRRLAALKQRHDTVRYHIFPYVEDIGSIYALADLVVSRAGAGSLAEVTARGLPSILIPYPYATDNHQVANAEWLEVAGAARVIPDEDFNDRLFWQAVSSLVYHPSVLREMADRSAALGRPRAAEELAALVADAAGKKLGTVWRVAEKGN